MTTLSQTLPEQTTLLDRRQRWRLPVDLQLACNEAMENWRLDGNTSRLWNEDASLWTGNDESKWLGWLISVDTHLPQVDTLHQFASEVKQEGFEHVLLLGMGGSVLSAEVLATTFGRVLDFPQVQVLDSTDPAQIQRFAAGINFAKTLFIVSSKSGSTLETMLLKEFFYSEAIKLLGPDEAGSHFVAVTDRDSKLHRVAEGEHFRRIFFGVPSISGRFSALSNFGLVPAAIIGIDLRRFLSRAREMVEFCRPRIPVELDPGVILGLILGVACDKGRDKITLITSHSLRGLAAWIEQLLAESLGKCGKGPLPVCDEDLGYVSAYGDDRTFCYLRDKRLPTPIEDALVGALEDAGHPVVQIDFEDKYDLGQEFFRWEVAVATAGAILRVNPFDQPDVEASKIATRQMTAQYEANGRLPPGVPVAEGNGLKLYADQRNSADLLSLSRGDQSVFAILKAHLGRLRPRDYFALLAYLDMNDESEALLQMIRHEVRDSRKVATSLGFGPRYLHSTGQAFKGGPNTGLFIQVTCDDTVDLPVPGHKYTFGMVKAAQAQGDFAVLGERGRRVLRVHIGADVSRDLKRLYDYILNALE